MEIKPSIILIPPCKSIKADTLRIQFSSTIVYACDFYIDEIEKAFPIAGGFRSGLIINIDHHAPVEAMANFNTSTSLAIDYVNTYGVAGNNDKIIINHTDCDSILSSLIIAGLLEPKEEYKHAALCADHTGEISEISEILQALEKERTVDLSIHSLMSFISTGKVASNIIPYLNAYRACRQRVHDYVSKAYSVGDIVVVPIDSDINSIMLLSCFPNAKIIMTVSPHLLYPQKMAISVMRGPKAPKALYINTLPLPPEFGGRWNMGSNKRSGGTSLPIDFYIEIIQKELERSS